MTDLPFEGMAAVAMIEAPALRRAVVAKEHEASVITFWRITQQVEESIVVEQKVLGIAELRTDDVRSLDWISAEENRLDSVSIRALGQSMRCDFTYEVQTDDVVVAFHRIEFDCKPSWISGLVGILPPRCDCREANEDRSFLTSALQEVRFLRWISEILLKYDCCLRSNCRHTVRSETSCVHSKKPKAPLPQGWTIPMQIIVSFSSIKTKRIKIFKVGTHALDSSIY